MKRPGGRPQCEHGRLDFDRCPKCHERDAQAKEAVRPLAANFWEHKGRNAGDLDHLLYRAYRLGMKHEPT
jgi:cytochrome c2